MRKIKASDHVTFVSNFFSKRIQTCFICFCCSYEAPEMCGSVAFLAVLVWFFSAESRSDTFMSEITRDYLDSFTNDFCGPCSNYEATPSRNSSGSCTCSGSIKCLTDKYGRPQGSVFVRSNAKCESSCNLTSKRCFKSLTVFMLETLKLSKGAFDWEIWI